jgi:hypothetical protein
MGAQDVFLNFILSAIEIHQDPGFSSFVSKLRIGELSDDSIDLILSCENLDYYAMADVLRQIAIRLLHLGRHCRSRVSKLQDQYQQLTAQLNQKDKHARALQRQIDEERKQYQERARGFESAAEHAGPPTAPRPAKKKDRKRKAKSHWQRPHSTLPVEPPHISVDLVQASGSVGTTPFPELPPAPQIKVEKPKTKVLMLDAEEKALLAAARAAVAPVKVDRTAKMLPLQIERRVKTEG